MKFKYYIVCFCMLLTLVGCQNEVEESAQLELSLCLPIQERATPLQNRAPGDPGTTEHFDLPKYVYIFVMKQNGSEWSLWRREERKLFSEKWQRTRYYGLNETRGDSIYKYTGEIRYLLNNEHPIGRVYAICSSKQLNFSHELSSSMMETLDSVLNWRFNSAPDSIQEDLANIYSTPYNYNRDGRYYCSFDCSAGTVCKLDMLMYHVASKVDIKWNVEDSVRIDKTDRTKTVRLTYMDAVNLYNGMAYCFKPMENVVASNPLSSGYTVHMVNNDEGLWWEGRSYFYTIPYTVSNSSTPGSYYPLQMVLRTNNSNDNYRPTIQLGIDATSPFVPWLRANFNLSKPLGDEEVTKTAGS